MRVAVVTLGSAGDLHPFLAVARGLARRGHDVHVLSQSPHEDEVRAEGLPFVAVADALAHQRTMQHPLLWHPLHGFGVLWRHLAVPAIGPTCDALGALGPMRGEPLVVLASPLAVGARFARERWPEWVRLVSGYTAPMALRSLSDPMFIGGWQVPAWMPPRARFALWWLLDHWKLEPMARPALERCRTQWGLEAPVGSTFGEWVHSPDLGIAMYPAWFAAMPTTPTGRRTVQAGFPLFTAARPARPDLDPVPSGPRRGPPVIIYPGSATHRSERLIHLACDACDEQDLPYIVLARTIDPTVEARIGRTAEAHHLRWADLPALLAHCRAIVHHGGIGTCAQALSARVPQVILASAYDQFENGSRLQELQLASYWPLRNATVKPLSRALLPQQLREARQRLQSAALPIIDGTVAVDQICDTIEGQGSSASQTNGACTSR